MFHIEKKNSSAGNIAGFTLLELIIVILISGIVISTMVLMQSTAARGITISTGSLKASILTDDVMREIRSKSFDDPILPATNFGTEAGETIRKNFDDVDDYDNFTQSPPQTIEGVVLTNYTGYSLKVDVSYVNSTDLDISIISTTNLKRISVMVTSPDKSVVISNVTIAGKYDQD